MKLSILILNYNTRELLKGCLESVLKHFSEGSYGEIIVIDNASKDGSPKMVMREYPSVKLIEMKENFGFSRAFNEGIKKSKGENVLLVNSDIIFEYNIFDHIIEYMEKHRKAAVVGPSQENGSGALLLTCGEFPALSNEIVRKYRTSAARKGRIKTQRYLNKKYSEPGSVDWVSGSLMCVRRSAIDKAGQLDENFFMYFEDIDWCARFKKCGYEVIYDPQIRAVHLDGQSAKKFADVSKISYRKSQLYFFEKYYGRNAALFLRAYVAGKYTLKNIALYSISAAKTRDNVQLKDKIRLNRKIVREVIKKGVSSPFRDRSE